MKWFFENFGEVPDQIRDASTDCRSDEKRDPDDGQKSDNIQKDT